MQMHNENDSWGINMGLERDLQGDSQDCENRWKDGFRSICNRKIQDSDLSREELAQELSVSPAYFSNMMNGRRPINKKRERQLSALLDIDLLRAYISIELIHNPQEYEEPMIVFAANLCCAILDKAQHLEAARNGKFIATVSSTQLAGVAERSIASLISHSDVIAQNDQQQVA